MLTEEDFRDQLPSSVQADLVGTQEAYHVSYFVELVRLAFLRTLVLLSPHMKKLIAVEWVGSYRSDIHLGVGGMMKQPSFLPLIFKRGNGFGFYFGGFNDIGTNKVANEHACYFIRSKIDSIVQDPEKARKLKPNELHARRPICDNGYYYAFNKPGVDIVHIGETPIVAIRENGIETTAGFHELDAIVFATGFDAVDGNYNRIRIRGRGGKSLKQYWDAREQGPSAYLGASVPEFPNMLMIGGPLGPFGNYPPVVETYTELISGLLAEAERARRLPGARPGGEGTIIEATKQAEDEWTTAAKNVIDSSLFKEANSWLFGNNVEGKKRAIRFHFGGMGHFYNTVHRVIDEGFAGFRPCLQNKSTTGHGADVKATKVHVEDAGVNGVSNTEVQ